MRKAPLILLLAAAALLFSGCGSDDGGGGGTSSSGGSSTSSGTSSSSSSSSSSGADTFSSSGADGTSSSGADGTSSSGADGTSSSGADGTSSSSGADSSGGGADCGDNIVDTGEDCDGSVPNGASCASEGFDDGILACSDSCSFDTSGCADNIAVPGPGDLVISEIMVAPATLTDQAGEWFEVRNPNALTTYDMTGCAILGTPAQQFNLSEPIFVAPQGHVTFASGNSPGFTPTKVFSPSQFGLDNSSDRIELRCAGETVDEVLYDVNNGFTITPGVSLSLTSNGTATDNDDSASWCDGTGNYNGDTGTPGSSNASCP